MTPPSCLGGSSVCLVGETNPALVGATFICTGRCKPDVPRSGMVGTRGSMVWCGVRLRPRMTMSSPPRPRSPSLSPPRLRVPPQSKSAREYSHAFLHSNGSCNFSSSIDTFIRWGAGLGIVLSLPSVETKQSLSLVGNRSTTVAPPTFFYRNRRF